MQRYDLVKAASGVYVTLRVRLVRARDDGEVVCAFKTAKEKKTSKQHGLGSQKVSGVFPWYAVLGRSFFSCYQSAFVMPPT